MATRTSDTGPDADGVKIIRATGVSGPVWLLALALLLVAATLFMVVRPALHKDLNETGGPSPANVRKNPAHDLNVDAVSVKHVPAAPVIRISQPQAPAANAEQPSAHKDSVAANEAAPTDAAPGAAGEARAASDDGEHDEPTGLALFPPPGTKPIKRGIVVPEDFELPPGYVRHYQTTDNGQRVPAILMFHPDYHPVDEHGVPIRLPVDRVVPPEMAPPGMPIQMLDVPEQPQIAGPAADQGVQDSTP
ncbi:MAG: hypothetical protein ACHQ4J_02710 [Candidatus Binatia bacterium]